MTTIISIGRNVKDYPLSHAVWDDFKTGLSVAASARGEIVFRGDGVGFYNGKVEDSYTVIYLPRPNASRIETALARLARRYGQESIALTRGETVFVEAK